jgi:hypothetical protein
MTTANEQENISILPDADTNVVIQTDDNNVIIQPDENIKVQQSSS